MKIIKIITINTLVFLFLFELLLRFFWNNSYVPFDDKVYFHKPFVSYEFTNINQLYDYKKKIILRTGKYGNIISKKKINIQKNQTYALALGGSSVESALVPEGLRWPDLLSIQTFNFGKSRLNSSHTVENLKYIFKNYDLKPKYIFIMDGVNNLSNYISYGENGLSSPEYSINKNIIKFIRKNYYTSALIINLIKKNNIFLFYKADTERRKKLEIHTNAFLSEFIRSNKKKMFDSLQSKLIEMKNISQSNNFKIIILTQPSSYYKNFKAYQYDLRTKPIIGGKTLTIEQAYNLFKFYNELTIEVAQSLNLSFVDINKCFDKKNTSDLFYDSFHFTVKGSKYFAKCLNKNLINIFE